MSITSLNHLKPRPNYGLIAVLLAALIMRIIYWPKGLLGGDSIGYALGGLGMWCAHPPGYFGYCFTAWLVNQVLANVKDSLALINVTTSLLGIVFCHRLALTFGMNARNALLTTAAYAFSINLDYFSVTTLSYAPEGMFVTLFAVLSCRSIQQQSMKVAFWATLVWAISGAFRQTSSTFLAPLWLYTLWKSGPHKRIPLYLLIALPIVFGWSRANKHYLTAQAGDLNADVGRDFWQLQVMQASNYDQTKLGLDEQVKKEGVSTHHWPFMEILQWGDEKTGLHFLPDYRTFGAPPPSLAHAAELAGLQLGKFGFYMLLSLPCLLTLILLLPRFMRISTLFKAGEIPFFLAWMVPAGGFFVVGQFGSFGYLQILLSGFSVLVVLLLSRAFSDTGDSRHWLKWQVAHACFTAAALAFFLLARPYQSADATEKLRDVLALQYTGHAVQKQYVVTRALANAPGPALQETWQWCKTDADIMKWYSTHKGAKTPLYHPHVVR